VANGRSDSLAGRRRTAQDVRRNRRAKPASPTLPASWADVAVHAPTGRDAALAVEILARWQITARLCADIGSLCGAIAQGVGVVVLAEEALFTAVRKQLLDALSAQPSWSDIPVILLTGEGELSRTITEGIEAVAEHGNVMLLERPIRIATLVTAVRSAVRARRRQYEIREYLSEREHLLESERGARAEAEKANRAKSEFLAIMSHELRTPLNAIAGYTELMELGVHGSVTDEQREALRRIQKSERHLLGLIEGVLSYARLETGRVNYHIEAVPTKDLIATTEALVAPQMRAHGLRLELTDCDWGIVVAADREKAQQILLNLVSNAIKFTPHGGWISIGCELVNEEVQFTVGDSGVGIPADKLGSIFEPFVQVDTRLTRTREGVGLGLAISRDLARGMSGDLTVASTLGVGSRFTLTLPRA
jgi:signal transduction histidine kinase